MLLSLAGCDGSDEQCGTAGTFPTVADGVVQGVVCFDGDGWGACNFHLAAAAVNCGGFFLFRLPSTTHASGWGGQNPDYLGYCTDDSNIPSAPPPPAPDPCVANPCNSDGQVMTCEKCPYRPTGIGSDGTEDHGMTARDFAGMVHCRLGDDLANCPAAGVLPSFALSWPSGTGLGPEMKCWRYGSSYFYNIPTSSPCVHGPSTPSTGGGH
jgi:hypothetical protein